MGEHIEVTSMRDIRRDQIKRALIVPNGGRKNAPRTRHLCQRELACSYQAMTNLSPLDQIMAMKDGNARKILKAAGHQIVILSHTADTGIRVETWKHRIRIGKEFFHSSVLFPCLSLKGKESIVQVEPAHFFQCQLDVECLQ